MDLKFRPAPEGLSALAKIQWMQWYDFTKDDEWNRHPYGCGDEPMPKVAAVPQVCAQIAL